MPPRNKSAEARPWEIWDKPGMAVNIDNYWQGSEAEKEYVTRKARQVKALMARPDTSILEVGCGTGLIYQALLHEIGSGMRYVGIDNSDAMLRIANRRFPRASMMKGDAFNLKGETADIVICFEVLGHMPDCQVPLNELFKAANRTLMLTYWATWEKKISAGQDHYEYPREEMTKRIAVAAGKTPYVMTEVDMPYTVMAIISKKVPVGN